MSGGGVAPVAARAGPVSLRKMGLREMKIGCWTTASCVEGGQPIRKPIRKRWPGLCSYRPHPTENSGTIAGGIRCTSLGDLPGASDFFRFMPRTRRGSRPVRTAALVYRGRRGRAARWAPVLSGPRLLCKPPVGRWKVLGTRPSQGRVKATVMRSEGDRNAVGMRRESHSGATGAHAQFHARNRSAARARAARP